MASAPINLKIISEVEGLNISWEVLDTRGLGPQYLYIRLKGSSKWGNPIVLSSTLRNYKVDNLMPGKSYEIRVETFEYKGSILSTAITSFPKEESSSSSIYYVSSKGSDTASGLAPSTAWQTTNKVNSMNLVPGSLVLFEGETVFHGELTGSNSGRKNEYINYSSYGQGKAIIENGIWIDSYDYLVFDNLSTPYIGGRGNDITVQNCILGNNSSDSAINCVKGNNWKILNNKIYKTGDSGILTQSGDNGGDPGNEWYIENNTIENTGLDNSINYGKHGIYLKCRNSKVINNVITGFSADGVSQRYGGCEIKNNKINSGSIGIAYFPYDSIVNTSNWEQNKIFNTDTGMYAPITDSGSPSPGGTTLENFDIIQNVIGPLKSNSKDYINIKTKGKLFQKENVLQ